MAIITSEIYSDRVCNKKRLNRGNKVEQRGICYFDLIITRRNDLLQPQRRSHTCCCCCCCSTTLATTTTAAATTTTAAATTTTAATTTIATTYSWIMFSTLKIQLEMAEKHQLNLKPPEWDE